MEVLADMTILRVERETSVAAAELVVVSLCFGKVKI